MYVYILKLCIYYAYIIHIFYAYVYVSISYIYLLSYVQGVVTSEVLRIQDADGNTCLMLACRSGNIDVVCELLDVINNEVNMRCLYMH